MAIQSRFISLTSYCLVEYMFEPLGSSSYLTDDVILLKNDKMGIYQMFNGDDSYNTTKNIQDLTAIPIGDNKMVYADSEKVPDFIDYSDDLTPITLSGYAVVYDKVRFHFTAGFDFEGFEALILSIKNRQNNGEYNLFANILFAPDTAQELLTLNPKPIFLSDRSYDRYIDIKIPSIKNINEEYIIAPVQANTFAANITPKEGGGYVGFITNAPIEISVYESSRKSKLYTDTGATYDQFEISEVYTGSVSQSNEFDDVGAYIGEADTGDFIEYYLTYNSGFPEELISILNGRNPSDDWIIIHQLSVFEQVGSSFINTSRLVIFQEDDWDEPILFRPVLKNAGSAVSMSIDLLCRLTNKTNGEQIIREASFSLLSPKKYGKNLTTIPLSDEPQSHKIYNKIIKKNYEATKLFIDPEFKDNEVNSGETKIVKQVEYFPVYTSSNNISISSNSGYLKVNDKADEIIFGPGQLKFIMSPFDNSIKFRLFNVVNKKPIPIDLNINGATYNIVFETDSGNISITNSNSDKKDNLSDGILRFEIAKAQSGDIYKSKKQTMYITSISQDGKETMMYAGSWRRGDQQIDVDSAISTAKSQSDEILSRESKIDELNKKIEKIEGDQTALKFNYGKNATIKKVGSASIVNRIGMKNPKKVKTNTSNAGRAQQYNTDYENFLKKKK